MGRSIVDKIRKLADAGHCVPSIAIQLDISAIEVERRGKQHDIWFRPRRLKRSLPKPPVQSLGKFQSISQAARFYGVGPKTAKTWFEPRTAFVRPAVRTLVEDTDGAFQRRLDKGLRHSVIARQLGVQPWDITAALRLRQSGHGQ